MRLSYVVLLLMSLNSFVASDFQGDALNAFRTSLNVSDMEDFSNWNIYQPDPCLWNNVECDDSSNVISITLSNMGISGVLSPKIGVLKTLLSLDLEGNRITGEIPKEFGNLSSLVSLELDNNQLTGEIPTSLGSLKKLLHLNLSRNHLVGSIPESITHIPNLIHIDLASNDLSGQVPDQLFQIRHFNFSGNNLNCGINFQPPCEPVTIDTATRDESRLWIFIIGLGGIIGVFLLGGLLLLSFQVLYCTIILVSKSSVKAN